MQRLDRFTGCHFTPLNCQRTDDSPKTGTWPELTLTWRRKTIIMATFDTTGAGTERADRALIGSSTLFLGWQKRVAR
jgi:hypothetical protein